MKSSLYGRNSKSEVESVIKSLKGLPEKYSSEKVAALIVELKEMKKHMK